ncbi:MAG: hemolysin III family protein [Thermoanaerobaculia bacterium]
MNRSHTITAYTLAEEVANAVTHGLGALLAVIGLVVLVVRASLHGDVWHITSASIFGATLVLCYLSSTLYHSIPHPRAKNVLRVLDHSAIFLLIAGTYTPFTLVSLRGNLGWWIFGVIWTCAALGITLGFAVKKWKGVVTAVLSVIMGWVAIVALGPLFKSLGPGGTALVIAGGLIYTAGVAFYGSRRVPWNHAVWHLFVLGGSVLHYFAILWFVVPGGS